MSFCLYPVNTPLSPLSPRSFSAPPTASLRLNYEPERSVTSFQRHANHPRARRVAQVALLPCKPSRTLATASGKAGCPWSRSHCDGASPFTVGPGGFYWGARPTVAKFPTDIRQSDIDTQGNFVHSFSFPTYIYILLYIYIAYCDAQNISTSPVNFKSFAIVV